MYKKILVPMDGSGVAECVMKEIGKLLSHDVEVFLLRVVEELRDVRSDSGFDGEVPEEIVNKFEKRNESNARRYLVKVAAGLRKKGVTVHEVVALGKPAETIVSEASKNKVDLIAIATHGRSGISRWAFGSVADKVLRFARVPVLLVTPTGARKS